MGKSWDNLVVTDKFNITGRGTVLIVDFVLSGLCQDLWEKDLPVRRVGDTILYEGMTYTIKGLDIHRNTFNGGLMTRVGLLVKN
jgi:hypothetical protein